MVDVRLISFVARGKRRKETLDLISGYQRISQSEIMRKLKQYKSHNSNTLKELQQKDLISCINPEERSFKFYKITKKGKEVLKEIEKISK